MNRLLGMVLVGVSAVTFGTLAIIGRYAYAAGMDVLTLLFLRFSLSGVLMALLLAARRERLPRGMTLVQLVAMGAIGYVGQAFSYFTAVKYASAGLVALLLYLYPVFVMLLSALWLREPITNWKLAALGLALAGLALTVGPAGGQWLGVMWGLAASVIYSLYIMVANRVVKEGSAIQSSTVILAAAGVVSGVLMVGTGPQFPTTGAGWAAVGAVVLVATVIPIVTFLAGLERIGPTNAAMLSVLEPLVTVLLAALLLGEALKPVTLLGGGLILASVLVVARGELGAARRVPAGQRGG
jgi:drug/metabolite transporter (DMT)-like permease